MAAVSPVRDGLPGSGSYTQGTVVEGRGAGRALFSQSQTLCFFFFSYIGSRVTSNMVIVEVSLLSGFILAPRSRMLVRTSE